MGAVGFVLISKLGTQQLLFRTDPRKKRRSKHWEIIADKSQERRGSLGYVSAMDSQGRTQREHQKSRTLLIAGSLGQYG
jgi:hypothetical protein